MKKLVFPFFIVTFSLFSYSNSFAQLSLNIYCKFGKYYPYGKVSSMGPVDLFPLLIDAKSLYNPSNFYGYDVEIELKGKFTISIAMSNLPVPFFSTKLSKTGRIIAESVIDYQYDQDIAIYISDLSFLVRYNLLNSSENNFIPHIGLGITRSEFQLDGGAQEVLPGVTAYERYERGSFGFVIPFGVDLNLSKSFLAKIYKDIWLRFEFETIYQINERNNPSVIRFSTGLLFKS